MLLFQGQCFIAIDPNQFEEGFTNRMQTLIDECRNQPPVCIIK
jgi:LDH2 family malate/lactate/ureidoglycolate dehydrogenase